MILLLAWIAVAAIARLIERTWWSPGGLLAITLTVSFAGAKLLAHQYPESVTANLYLQGLVLATVAGSSLGQASTRLASARPRSLGLRIRKRRSFILLGIMSSLASLVITLQVTGISASALTSPLSVLRAAQSATHSRYTTGLNFPIYYNVSNSLVLTYAMLTALHFTTRRRFDFAMSTPLLIFIASNLVITTRAPILFMLLLMGLASAYTAKALSIGDAFPSLTSPRAIATVGGVVSVVIAVFVFFEVLRFGEHNTRSAADVWLHIRRWPLGSLSSFSIWFDTGAFSMPGHPVGYYTLMGLYDNLGIDHRQVGTYVTYVTLAPGETSNVYTAFRGMIHDYGLVATPILMCALGFVGGAAARMRTFSFQTGIALYVGVCGYLGFSLFVSLWAYTSNLLALALLPISIKFFCGGGQLPSPGATEVESRA